MTTQKSALKEEEFTGHFSWPVWKRVFVFASPHKRRIAGLVAAALVLGGLEIAFPLIQRAMINDIEDNALDTNLWMYASAYAAVAAMLCLMIFSFIMLAGKISTDMAHDIRQAGFDKLQKLSFSYYDKRPVGWIITRMTSDCDRLSRLIAWGTLDLSWGICMLIGVSIAMLMLQWQVALVVMVIIPPMAVLSVVFQRRLLGTSRKVRKTNSNITAAFSEAIMGVRTTKALVREDENLGEFEGITDEMLSSSVRNAVLSAAFFPIMISMTSLGGGLALWFGGVRTIGGLMRIGDLVAFIGLTGMMIHPIRELTRVFTDAQAAQAAAERVTGLIDMESDIQDSHEVQAAIGRHSQSPLSADVAEDGMRDSIDEIEFRNISFAYQDGKDVLRDFSLKVTSGETIALVGPTGGGKSTIVSLLCRFYQPTKGEILFDGLDYRKRSLKWLQSHLGIVLQTPQLFSGTIRENIRYGKLEATDERVEWAARLVNAHEFIMEFDDGYDSEVGEGGNRLSRGQKQLVSFARAVLAEPQIFVMDEATSSVDTETEQLIQAALANVLEGRISFIIAHRLSTIRSADQILVIEDGKVVEQGDHAELIALGGKYFELYTNQFSDEKQNEILTNSAERTKG